MRKDVLRERVWRELKRYAKPDSRFHYDFSEFIPDFEGSERCASAVREMEEYASARLLFITPDNCLEKLRMYAILDEKPFIMPTYGIRRGFVYIDRSTVPEGKEDFAATLDGAERFGRYVTLSEIARMGRVDLLVTGASLVSVRGVRYGKGHGYFDLEWAMLREIGVVDDDTPIIAVVHDVQVAGEEVEADEYDTIVDYIVTPTRIIRVEERRPKPRGIDWSKVSPSMVEEIPPLRELYAKRAEC